MEHQNTIPWKLLGLDGEDSAFFNIIPSTIQTTPLSEPVNHRNGDSTAPEKYVYIYIYVQLVRWIFKTRKDCDKIGRSHWGKNNINSTNLGSETSNAKATSIELRYFKASHV
jgi:hypothetical protein